MMTIAECLDAGGHCYEDATFSISTGYTTTTQQKCKHCPASRLKISRHPYEYKDTTPKEFLV